jgi:hypothetical protein
MPTREDRALDRFLQEQKPRLLGRQVELASVLAMGINAGVQATISAAFLVAGAMTGEPGPWVAGGALAAVAVGLGGFTAWLARRRRAQLTGAEVRLSNEALELLRSVYGQLDVWAGSRRRRAADVLSPAAFELLDAAAHEHNRIMGSLAIAESVSGAALTPMAPTIRAAADQAMAEVLHNGALVNRYPESAAAQVEQARERAQELRELADRVERLQSEVARPAGLGAPSAVREVLDALAHEESARKELRAASEEAEVRTLYRGS